jgi:hypothetical protein
MTRKNHQDIYDQLTSKWQEDKFRRQQEILNIGKRTWVDKLFPWLFTAGCAVGIYIVIQFANNK